MSLFARMRALYVEAILEMQDERLRHFSPADVQALKINRLSWEKVASGAAKAPFQALQEEDITLGKKVAVRDVRIEFEHQWYTNGKVDKIRNDGTIEVVTTAPPNPDGSPRQIRSFIAKEDIAKMIRTCPSVALGVPVQELQSQAMDFLIGQQVAVRHARIEHQWYIDGIVEGIFPDGTIQVVTTAPPKSKSQERVLFYTNVRPQFIATMISKLEGAAAAQVPGIGLGAGTAPVPEYVDCLVCGKPAKANKANKKFCSMECMEAAQRFYSHCLKCGDQLYGALAGVAYCSLACKELHGLANSADI